MFLCAEAESSRNDERIPSIQKHFFNVPLWIQFHFLRLWHNLIHYLISFWFIFIFLFRKPISLHTLKNICSICLCLDVMTHVWTFLFSNSTQHNSKCWCLAMNECSCRFTTYNSRVEQLEQNDRNVHKGNINNNRNNSFYPLPNPSGSPAYICVCPSSFLCLHLSNISSLNFFECNYLCSFFQCSVQWVSEIDFINYVCLKLVGEIIFPPISSSETQENKWIGRCLGEFLIWFLT